MATFAALLAVVLAWGLVSERLARYSIAAINGADSGVETTASSAFKPFTPV